MKKFRFWLIIALPLVAISCKKDEGTPAPATVTYLNIASGNVWNFELTKNVSTAPAVSTYSLTSSTTDTTINARQYHIFNRSTGDKEYFYITGNDYYEYLILPFLDTIKTENLYLKSGANAGDNWTQNVAPITYSGITANLSKSDTVIEKGLTKIVKGITYTDVVRVRGGLKILSISFPGLSPTLTSVLDNYYAPKVGKIYSYIKLRLQLNSPLLPAPIDQTFENKTELVSTNF